MNIGLHFGALSDSVTDQLKQQNVNFDISKAKQFDKMADALTTLHLGGILTDSMRHKCNAKLHAKIVKHVCEKNGLKPVKTLTR